MSAVPNVGPKEISENSPVQMAEVIAGLLQGRTVTDIAETVGVPRRRILRWYRESERFQEMLAETTDEIVALVRSEVTRETADRMTELLPAAVDTLKRALDPEYDAKMSERISAAAHVMRFSGLGNKAAPTGRPQVETLIRGTTADGPATGD